MDALRAVSARVEELTRKSNLGVLAITHYTRLLEQLHPDVIHILADGQIVKTGGPELADELEEDGYAAYLPAPEPAQEKGTAVALHRSDDPFAEPLLGR